MMGDVELQIDEKGYGSFYILDGEERIAEMELSISGDEMTVYHTDVQPGQEGKGLGKKLLNTMADYARKNGMTVKALCPFVHAQFKRHPEEYADIISR